MAKIIEEARLGIRARCEHCDRRIEFEICEVKKQQRVTGCGFSAMIYYVMCPGCHKNFKVNKELGLTPKGFASKEHEDNNRPPRIESEISYLDPWRIVIN